MAGLAIDLHDDDEPTCLDVQYTRRDDRLQVHVLLTDVVQWRRRQYFQTSLPRPLLRDAGSRRPARRRLKIIGVVRSWRNWNVFGQDDVVTHDFRISNAALASSAVDKSIRRATVICSLGGEDLDWLLGVVSGAVEDRASVLTAADSCRFARGNAAGNVEMTVDVALVWL